MTVDEAGRLGAEMQYRTGAALVMAAAFLWSLQGLMFRQIETAGPWETLFWRSAGMIPVLAVFIAWRAEGRFLAAMRGVGRAEVIGGLCLVLAFGGTVYAIQTTTVANAVFLFAASPFIAAFLGWALLGERVRRATWISIVVVLVGIGIMVQGGLERGALLGNVAALTAAAGFAVFTVILRAGGRADTLPVVFLGGVFAATAAAGMTGFAGGTLAVPAADAGWALAMGAVTLSGGMALYTLGSRVVPAADLTLLTMLEVMLAPLWVWVFLGETASGATLLGGGFVLGAVLLNAMGGARRGTVPA
jgi:drug/metabolite transporter, DME family